MITGNRGWIFQLLCSPCWLCTASRRHRPSGFYFLHPPYPHTYLSLPVCIQSESFWDIIHHNHLISDTVTSGDFRARVGDGPAKAMRSQSQEKPGFGKEASAGPLCPNWGLDRFQHPWKGSTFYWKWQKNELARWLKRLLTLLYSVRLPMTL
jgi:hypothetical protein